MSPALASPATSPAASDAGEFAFDAADLERIRKLICQHAGISLNPGKQAMVYCRVSRRLRHTGQRSFAS